MNKKPVFTSITTLVLAFLLLTLFSGCGRQNHPAETAAPVSPAETVVTAAPAASPGIETEIGRQDGERFEETIILEGMEETVRYEHVRNEAIGFEMDYDYENFARRSSADRECFVSVWDLPDAPENYLELTYRAEDAGAVAASVRETLSQKYTLLEGSRELERAGSCIRIEASELKGTGTMADQLQVVYIISASDGCRVATEHFAAEASEGFGRRFSYMLNTLAVVDRNGGNTLTDEQALSAIRNYCYACNPDLESLVNAGGYPAYWDISSSDEQQTVVLFRSYTGAQIRYYIDRITGEAYVTEFVPGISSGEERTEERLNVRDYLS